MSQDNFTPEQHFEYIRDLHWGHFQDIRGYLHGLDGDTSRAIGRIVYDLVEKNKHLDNTLHWPSVMVAEFLHHDTVLWNELADSRKK